MTIKVEGKNGIKVEVVAASISKTGQRITTFEGEVHRYVWAEFMTHRLFSRNAMSSRAVPVDKTIDNTDAVPVHWGKNQRGMQAEVENTSEVIVPVEDHLVQLPREEAWNAWRDINCEFATAFSEAGYHKQIVNRPLEAFQRIKFVMTTTELDNFFWLRLASDAQPEIVELANCMYEAYNKSEPMLLTRGEWHTPYVSRSRDINGELKYAVKDYQGTTTQLTAEDACKVSSSCCAQVSYRNIDNTLEKANSVYERLGVGTNKIHASAFEHCGTPVLPDFSNEGDMLEEFYETEGVTHLDKQGNFWSGNFKNWIQYRQLLPNHTCTDYKPQ